jgi:hypothetical protein
LFAYDQQIGFYQEGSGLVFVKGNAASVPEIVVLAPWTDFVVLQTDDSVFLAIGFFSHVLGTGHEAGSDLVHTDSPSDAVSGQVRTGPPRIDCPQAA